MRMTRKPLTPALSPEYRGEGVKSPSPLPFRPLLSNLVIPFQNSPRPNRQRRRRHVAADFRFRPDQHRPAAGDRTFHLSAHDQAPDRHLIGDYVSLFLDRDNAAGFDDSARFVGLEAKVFQTK